MQNRWEDESSAPWVFAVLITEQEFDHILSDETKKIEINLAWKDDEDHSPARVFRTAVLSDEAYPLEVVGRWNPKAAKLSYVLLHRNSGRIYGLDMGARHRNPTGEEVGETHKHRWTTEFRDKEAYVPLDITATWDQPVVVWEQFCAEAGIAHLGTLDEPSWQEDLAL